MSFIKNKKIFYGIIIAFIVLLSGLFLYLRMAGQKPSNVQEPSKQITQKSVLSSFNLKVFRSDFFKSLVRYGKYPIKPRYPGRQNPFEPY